MNAKLKTDIGLERQALGFVSACLDEWKARRDAGEVTWYSSEEIEKYIAYYEERVAFWDEALKLVLQGAQMAVADEAIALVAAGKGVQ